LQSMTLELTSHDTVSRGVTGRPGVMYGQCIGVFIDLIRLRKS
jgi:hypothetical protein